MKWLGAACQAAAMASLDCDAMDREVYVAGGVGQRFANGVKGGPHGVVSCGSDGNRIEVGLRSTADGHVSRW